MKSQIVSFMGSRRGSLPSTEIGGGNDLFRAFLNGTPNHCFQPPLPPRSRETHQLS